MKFIIFWTREESFTTEIEADSIEEAREKWTKLPEGQKNDRIDEIWGGKGYKFEPKP